MKNTLKKIHTLDVNDKQIFKNFKQLFLNYRYTNTFFEVICKTRNYEYGLMLCDKFDHILELYKDCLTNKNYQSIDKGIIGLRLLCLDKSDRWFRYLDTFEKVFIEKSYELTYSRDCEIERFGRFYKRSDRHSHFIHFLYMDEHRREIIKRKADRLVEGKSTDHLKHHPQSELTDEEIEQRYYEILNLKW